MGREEGAEESKWPRVILSVRKREGWKETAGLDHAKLAWGGPQKAEEKREGDELTGRCQAWNQLEDVHRGGKASCRREVNSVGST